MEYLLPILFSFLATSVTFVPFIFLLVLVVLFAKIAKNSQRITPEEKTAARKRGLAWLEEQVPGLVSWQPDSLTELSGSCQRHSFHQTPSSWVRNYRIWIRLEVTGTINSLHTEDKLIAIFMYRRIKESLILAATSHQKWEIHFANNLAKIYLNRTPFGQWRISDGILFSAQAEAIGEARRKSRSGYLISGLTSRRQDRFYPVRLRKREIGAINNATQVTTAVQGSEQHPLVTSVSFLLDREAEDWLLALAIIETVCYYLNK